MTSPEVIEVLLIDEHLLSRAAMQTLIDNEPQFRVVGGLEASEEGLEALETLPSADVVLLKIDSVHQLSLLTSLVARRKLLVIVVAGIDGREIRSEVLRRGAAGLVTKAQPPEVLFAAIKHVHGGEVWFSRSVMAAVLSEALNPRETTTTSTSPLATLSEREHEVIKQIGLGLKNQEIGARLRISESTVRHHLSSIYKKLEVSDRLELLIFAYRHRLVELEIVPR